MRNILLTSVLLLSSFTVSAQPLTWISGRMSALGGGHAADGKTFSARFYNPAYLALDKNETLYSDISLSFSGFNDKIVGLITDQDYLGLLPVEEGTYFKADLSGPLNSGFIRDNTGFRAFNQINVLSFTPNMVVSSAFRIRSVMAFEGGHGWELPLPGSWRGKAYWGFLGKYIIGWEYIYSDDVLEFLYSLSKPSLLLESPMTVKTGAGLDFGAVHVLSNSFSWAITAHDLLTPYAEFTYDSAEDYGQSNGYSSVEFGLAPVVVSAGIKYSPAVFRKNRWIGPWDIFFDYRDIFAFAYDDPVNPILNIGIGTELTLLNIIDLRLGMTEGLFSMGTAIKFKHWGAGISFYGNELSGEPGVFSVYSVKLNIEFHK